MTSEIYPNMTFTLKQTPHRKRQNNLPNTPYTPRGSVASQVTLSELKMPLDLFNRTFDRPPGPFHQILRALSFLQVKLSEPDSSASECAISREVAQWKTSFWLNLNYAEVSFYVHAFAKFAFF